MLRRFAKFCSKFARRAQRTKFFGISHFIGVADELYSGDSHHGWTRRELVMIVPNQTQAVDDVRQLVVTRLLQDMFDQAEEPDAKGGSQCTLLTTCLRKLDR